MLNLAVIIPIDLAIMYAACYTIFAMAARYKQYALDKEVFDVETFEKIRGEQETTVSALFNYLLDLGKRDLAKKHAQQANGHSKQ